MAHHAAVGSSLLRGLFVLLAMGSLSSIDAQSPDPLHERIDRIVENASRIAFTGQIDDLNFIRRVSIDLTGMPPNQEEVHAFVADSSPDKRERLVDRLLQSSLFDQHLTTTLDVMLMERRRNQHVKQDEWRGYLLESVKANKPWNVLAKEILAADGVDPKLRPAVRFYLDRDSEPNLLTRDVSRVFFGKDFQCNQCHDHPVIDDYKQSDYHGVYAFLAAGYEFKAPDKKSYYAEKAGAEATFASVFFSDDVKRTAPKLPGMAEIEEPRFYPGDEYKVKPDKTVRPVVKYSRRTKLAELAASGENRAFNENIANRLWAMMLGRGLVHPIDLHHSANPPAYPELMTLLGEEIARMNFDMRAFLKQIALSRTYQRPLELPQNLAERSQQLAGTLPQLNEQVESLKNETTQLDEAYAKAKEEWQTAKDSSADARKSLEEALKKATDAYKKYEAAEKALQAAQAKLQPKLDQANIYSSVTSPVDAALATIGKHESLENATKLYRDRLANLQKEIAPLQKAVDDKQKAMETPTAEMNAARKVVDDARVALAPFEKTIAEKHIAVIELRGKMLESWEQLTQLQSRQSMLEEFVSYSKLDQQAIVAEQKLAELEKPYLAAKAEFDRQKAAHANKQKEFTTAKAEFEKTSAQMTAMTSRLEKLEPAIDSLTGALADARKALETLKSNSVITQQVSLLEVQAENYKREYLTTSKTLGEVEKAMQTIEPRRTKLKSELEASTNDLKALEAKLMEAEKSYLAIKVEAETARQQADAVVTAQTRKWAEQFVISPLKPLTPEQLAMSALQVTGLWETYFTNALAELNKKQPLSEEAQKDPAQVAAREREARELAYQKLSGSVNSFVGIYGGVAGQSQYDFFATVDQALFASNGGNLLSWVRPSGQNVTNRMMQEENPDKIAEILYMSILVRKPTETETLAVADYLKSRPEDKSACVQEMAWALLNSVEFRFNH